VPGKATPPNPDVPRATPASAATPPGNTPPKRPAGRTPQGAPTPPPPAEDPIIEEEAEVITASAPVAEQQTPSGKQIAARSHNLGAGSRKSSSSIKAASSSSEGGDDEHRRKGGAPKPRDGGEIGNLQRRGWSLSLKISVFTLLIIGLVTALFGYVSVQGMRTSILSEIKRSGYNSIMGLHAFGQRVAKPLKAMHDETRFHEALAAYKNSEDFAQDLAHIKRIKNADSRIKDVAIFASHAATDAPNNPVLRATESKNFEAAKQRNNAIEGVLSTDQDFEWYYANYDGENCLWFRMPIEKAPNRQMFSMAVIIMSVRQVEDQVQGVFNNLVIFGVLFAAAGLGMSLWLASLITRPVNVLVNDVNTVARGEFEHESTVPNQTKDEIGLLAMAFNRMTRNLREARDKEREAQRLSSEVNTAKTIHARLIPEKRPDLPGLDIFTAYNCAKEVGGDYYDFIPVGDAEHLAFCVADVSGKGIPGSMVMGTTRTYLRLMAVNNFSPASVLSKTNFHVAREIKRGMFVTCVYAMLNLRTRELTVASAGHNPMLIWRAATRSIEKVRPNGIALGFDKGPIFDRTVREEKVKLKSGDRVVMYTDGVVESMNEAREEWSDEALDQFTLDHATMASKDYVRLLMKALEEHQGKAEQHDDITVVTFRLL
jgi:serine phosphatase RsbU (regulator of sigma subunit)